MNAFLGKTKHLFTGYTSGKAQDRDVQQRTVAVIASFALPTALIFSGINYFHDHVWLAMMLLLAAVLLLPCFKLVREDKFLSRSANLLMAIAFFIFMSLFIDGGIGNTAILWPVIFPFLAALLVGLPRAWYWSIGFLVVLIGLVTTHFMGLLMLAYNDDMLLFFPAAFLFFALIAASFEMHQERLHVRYVESIMELENLKDRLEESVRKRTKALEFANHKLVDEMKGHQETTKELLESEERFYQAQKMESVGTLVGGIAHDFNNMLAGINANIFLMKRKAEGNPDTLSRAGDIENLVFSASDMVKQLLTFARKDQVTFNQFDLASFINVAYGLAQVAIPKAIQIRLESDEHDLPVQANKTQIQQVLMNMVNNAKDALKHSKNPSIIVRLERYEASERFKINNPELGEDVYAKLSIIDNGSGIESAKVDKIFEPFFTTKEVGKGTGLGLAMCYGAIQSHSGIIKVNSELGAGTAFTIYLPLSHSDWTKETTQQIIEDREGLGKTILLVDDDDQLRGAEKEALTVLGFNIVEAINGREAVLVYKEHHENIDLVILDLTMPVMGGVEAANHMRKIQQDVSIIYVSGYDRDSTYGEGLPSIDDTLLEKPFSMEKLNHAIQEKLSDS
ncbi:MAG: ATP-binding protein [Ghiorsea sp.]